MFLLWVIWWNITPYFLQMHVCTKFMETTSMIPCITSFKSTFGFTDVWDDNFLSVNHLLLIFKYSIYNSRVNNSLSFQSLKCDISQKKKQQSERVVCLIKQCGHVCMHVIFIITFLFVCLFVCFLVVFL